jgi:hypothetical protein
MFDDGIEVHIIETDNNYKLTDEITIPVLKVRPHGIATDGVWVTANSIDFDSHRLE